MQERLSIRWKKLSPTIRRPIILTVGMSIVLLSGAIGWLPGPGGIPLFLLGIAILSSEFHWAERIKKVILGIIYSIGRWLRSHRIAGTLLIIACIALSSMIVYMLLQFK